MLFLERTWATAGTVGCRGTSAKGCIFCDFVPSSLFEYVSSVTMETSESVMGFKTGIGDSHIRSYSFPGMVFRKKYNI